MIPLKYKNHSEKSLQKKPFQLLNFTVSQRIDFIGVLRLCPSGHLLLDRLSGSEGTDVVHHSLVEPATFAVPPVDGVRVCREFEVFRHVALRDAQEAFEEERKRPRAVSPAVAMEIDHFTLPQPLDDATDGVLVLMGGLAGRDFDIHVLVSARHEIVPQLDVLVDDRIRRQPGVLLPAASLASRGQAPQVQVNTDAEPVEDDVLLGRILLDVVQVGAAVDHSVPDRLVAGLPAAEVAGVLEQPVDHPLGALRNHAGLPQDRAVRSKDGIEAAHARNEVVDRRRRVLDLDLLVSREIRRGGNPQGSGLPFPGEGDRIGLVRTGEKGHLGTRVIGIVGIVHLLQERTDARVLDVVLALLLVVHPLGVQGGGAELVAVEGDGIGGAHRPLHAVPLEEEGVSLPEVGRQGDQVVPDVLLERLALRSRQRHLGDALRDLLDLRGPLAHVDGELPGERLSAVGQQRDATDVVPVQHEPEARAHVVESQLGRLRAGDRDEQVVVEGPRNSDLLVRKARRDDIRGNRRVSVIGIQAIDDLLRAVTRQRPLEEGRGRLLRIIGREGSHLPSTEHRDVFLRHPEDGGVILVQSRPRPAVPFHIGRKDDLFGRRRKDLLFLDGAGGKQEHDGPEA